jgi:RimJ/RimL family protein N-acetyltransferase
MGDGVVVGQCSGLATVCAASLTAERRVMILRTADTMRAVLTPDVATQLDLPTGQSWSEQVLRSALVAAHLLLHPPDAIHYVTDEARSALTSEVGPSDVRRLTGDDRGAFSVFVTSAPEQDLDDAGVELDHWAVLGAFDRERLVCVASMYPWDGSRLADLGVLTLPGYRGRGLARAVVRECCRFAYRQGHELQYRCQVDNVASRALAVSAGLTWFGDWEVISPDSPT